MNEAKKNRIGDIFLYLLVISIFCFDGDASLNSLVYISAVLFMGYMVIYLLQNRFLNVYYFLSWLPFMVVCFLSCIWSIDYGASQSRCFTLLLNYILFGLMFVYVNDFNGVETLTNGIAIAGGIFAVYIVFAYGGIASFISIMSSTNSVGRIGDEVAHISRIGQSLSIACILTFNLAFECKEKKRRFIYLFLMMIEILVILASQSRTSLAVAVIGSLISLIFQMRYKSSQHWIVAVICLITFIFILSQFVDLSLLLGRWEGIADIFRDGTGDASANARIGMLSEGWERFIEKPILGWGINSSGLISSYRTYFHNNYIEILATVGLIGLISFYYVYIKNFSYLVKARAKDFYTSLAIVLLLIQALLMISTVSYYVKYQYLVIVYFMAVAYRNRSSKTYSQENTMEELHL